MKKLITLSILFVLTSIFVSCKSSSVMKRRYNKGYYVHHAARHSEPKAIETAANTKTPLVKAPVVTEQVKAATVTKPIVQPSANLTAEANKSANTKTVAKENTSKTGLTKNSVKVIPTAFSQKRQLQLLKELVVKAKSGDPADDALSLLWILILVLLILYLLGFAFNDYGVGSAIHILAVVIVVLLILWLLRIL
jgi:hypothetical protein